MKEKKVNKAVILIVVLLVLTGAAAILHLSTREKVADGTIQLINGQETLEIAFSELPMDQVTGKRINGKGEEKEVNAPGISVQNLLNLKEVDTFAEVQIISDDSYTASLTKEEVEAEGKAYLILEENELRLVVFGDQNSKRSVSNVVRIEIVQ